jgi:hypothetical protein
MKITPWIETKRQRKAGCVFVHVAIYDAFQEENDRFCPCDDMEIYKAEIKGIFLLDCKEPERIHGRFSGERHIQLLLGFFPEYSTWIFFSLNDFYFAEGRSSVIMKGALSVVYGQAGQAAVFQLAVYAMSEAYFIEMQWDPDEMNGIVRMQCIPLEQRLLEDI